MSAPLCVPIDGTTGPEGDVGDAGTALVPQRASQYLSNTLSRSPLSQTNLGFLQQAAQSWLTIPGGLSTTPTLAAGFYLVSCRLRGGVSGFPQLMGTGGVQFLLRFVFPAPWGTITIPGNSWSNLRYVVDGGWQCVFSVLMLTPGTISATLQTTGSATYSPSITLEIDTSFTKLV